MGVAMRDYRHSTSESGADVPIIQIYRKYVATCHSACVPATCLKFSIDEEDPIWYPIFVVIS